MSPRRANLLVAFVALAAASPFCACKTRKADADTVTAPSASASSAPSPQAAVQDFVARRVELLKAEHFDDATKLCNEWLAREDAFSRAEGHKCAANVSVSRQPDRGRKLVISDSSQRLAVGGLAPKPRYAAEDVQAAIAHLDQAAKLAPTDTSIHEGRLFLRVSSGDYSGAVASLATSLDEHPGSKASDWSSFLASFPPDAAEQAVAFASLLVERYPKAAVAHATLGEWLGVAGKLGEGVASLRRALELAPGDAMARWRLGELLDRQGKQTLALEQYRESLALGGALLGERQAAYDQRVRKP